MPWLLMPRRARIVKHLPREELDGRYRAERNGRVKERLLAILHLYDGKKVLDAAKSVKRCEKSVRNWLKRWNERGCEGLKPGFKGGPKPRMPEGEWDRIIKEIEDKGMTLKDVTVYLKDTRGVEYSYKTVWKVLRKKKGVRYGKPYIRNRRRPVDAEAILKNGSRKLSQT